MSRDTCLQCFRIQLLCLCSEITHFEIQPLIILLVHPKEFMKTIGTVRIVKLSLKSSIMIRGRGEEFDHDTAFLKLIANPDLYPVVLFPGSNSINLSTVDSKTLSDAIPNDKRLAIFVIDGTWTEAKQIIRESKILSQLPKLSFDVTVPSVYEFRKQPKKFCLSTVEAVALLIESLRRKGLCNPVPENGHQTMLAGFKKLIQSQLAHKGNQ